MSKSYTVKKTKDGDYQVTLHNQTSTFMLKSVVLDFMEAQRFLKEVSAQARLDKAILVNIQDHHPDAISVFKKLPKLKQTALVNYLDLLQKTDNTSKKLSDARSRVVRLKRILDDVRAVIPADDKKLTKSEARRIAAMKKAKK